MRATATSNGPVSAPMNPVWMTLAQAVMAATVPLQQLNGAIRGYHSRPAGQAPFLLSCSVIASLTKLSKPN